VQVTEIERGLWRWTGFHEEWGEEVASTYVETGDGICLIDPIVPPEDPERFHRALDRDVERTGLPVHVLLTVFWHARDARALRERYGARLWAPARARAAATRRAGEVTDPFRPGAELPCGIQAFATGRGAEVVLLLPRHRAIVAGDVLLGDAGRLGHDGLRAALRPLLDLEVERVLVSHGAPVLADGGQALARTLAA
jgi:hypothetical protein